MIQGLRIVIVGLICLVGSAGGYAQGLTSQIQDDLTLRWQADPFASLYQVEITPDRAFAAAEILETSDTSLTLRRSVGEYKVRIRGCPAVASLETCEIAGPWSDARTFAVAVSPETSIRLVNRVLQGGWANGVRTPALSLEPSPGLFDLSRGEIDRRPRYSSDQQQRMLPSSWRMVELCTNSRDPRRVSSCGGGDALMSVRYDTGRAEARVLVYERETPEDARSFRARFDGADRQASAYASGRYVFVVQAVFQTDRNRLLSVLGVPAAERIRLQPGDLPPGFRLTSEGNIDTEALASLQRLNPGLRSVYEQRFESPLSDQPLVVRFSIFETVGAAQSAYRSLQNRDDGDRFRWGGNVISEVRLNG